MNKKLTSIDGTNKSKISGIKDAAVSARSTNDEMPNRKCQLESGPTASSDSTTIKFQTPSELDVTLLDTTLLDIVFNGCDMTNKDDKDKAEQTAVVRTAIEEQVSLLCSEIRTQRGIISMLQQQLRSVLSVLGIAEQDILLISDESKATEKTISSQTDVAQRSDDQPTWNQKTANAQPPKEPNQPEQKKPRKLVTNFQQSLIAAVYVDQSEQKRRESSLIVSGLQESKSESDKLVFTNLCETEFRMKPDIVSTKRLGRFQPTKIRPLLIVTRKADQAQHLIKKAKHLRKSSHKTVRESVFINRNLTKAEAEAAFCLRVQRRQMAAHHADNSIRSANVDNQRSPAIDHDNYNATNVLPHPQPAIKTVLESELDGDETLAPASGDLSSDIASRPSAASGVRSTDSALSPTAGRLSHQQQ